MNLHTVGLQNLKKLAPSPLEPEASPGIPTPVESLWPKRWLRIPATYYSLYSVNNQVLYTHIPGCEIRALDSSSALSLPWQPQTKELMS